MSLHGTINLNGRQLIAWTARRLADHPQEINEYECRVSNRLDDFTVTHRYSDGAAVLAAKVLVASVVTEQSDVDPDVLAALLGSGALAAASAPLLVPEGDN